MTRMGFRNQQHFLGSLKCQLMGYCWDVDLSRSLNLRHTVHLPHGRNPTRMNNKHLCSAQISLQDFVHPIFVGSHAVSLSTSGLNRTHQLRFWLQWSTRWSINSSCIMNFRLVCSSMKLTLLLLLKNWIDHQSPIVVASFFVCLAFTGSNSI